MAKYINSFQFLPTGTINILSEEGVWDRQTYDWEEMIDRMENKALSVIGILINFKAIENDLALVEELVSLHVKYQLFMPLVHMNGFTDQGVIAINQFNDLIDMIRANQEKMGLLAGSDENVGVAGLMVFNKKGGK